MKDHFEALSKVMGRGADCKAFRKFMKVRVAHWDALWEEYTKPRWIRLRMNLYCGKQRAFANFFNQLSALKEDENQRLVVAYGAGRWKTQKGTTPAPTTRTYKECARRFVTIPVDDFRTSYTHHELGCTLQWVEMEKPQRSPKDIAKYGPLTEEQMESRAKVRGLLALVSTTNDGKKRMEFVYRAFNAAINTRRYAVLETRPPVLTRENFVRQPFKVKLYEKKLEAVVGGRSKKLGRVCTLVGEVLSTAGRSPLLYTGGSVFLLKGVCYRCRGQKKLLKAITRLDQDRTKATACEQQQRCSSCPMSSGTRSQTERRR